MKEKYIFVRDFDAIKLTLKLLSILAIGEVIMWYLHGRKIRYCRAWSFVQVIGVMLIVLYGTDIRTVKRYTS